MNNESVVRIPSVILISLTLVALTAIGWLTSPRDEKGRPLLLLPDVKAVENYRRMAVGWNDALALVDGEIATILSGDTTNLFGQSRLAQETFEHILRIAQQIDQQEVPPAMIGLHQGIKDASQAYLEASRLALRWLSLPDTENSQTAQGKLSAARSLLNELENSQWLEKRLP